MTCGNVNHKKLLRDSVVSVTSAIVKVLIVSETVNFVTVSFVTVTFVNASFASTRAHRNSSTTLKLSENVNTLLFFCRIPAGRSLKLILYLSENVIDYENGIFSFFDSFFPSSSFSVLNKPSPNLKDHVHQFPNVFLFLSDIFLLCASVNVNANVNAIDDSLVSVVPPLYVNDLVRNAIQYNQSEIYIFHLVRSSFL